MRLLSTLALSLLASLVGAISVPGLPKCAGACVDPSRLDGCQLLQVKCICTNKALLANLSCCLSVNCSPADQAGMSPALASLGTITRPLY